jgi:hypothetical protein
MPLGDCAYPADLGTTVGVFERLENRVDPSLVAPSSAPEPLDDVGIDPKGDLRFASHRL